MIAVSLAAEISENNLKCVLGYLKEGGSLNEDSFPAAPYSGNKLNCDKFIKEQTQKVMKDVKASLDEDVSPGELACILKDLENQFYPDYFLKTVVYNNYAGMDRTERIDLIAANDELHEKMLDNVVSRCGEENLFNSHFHNNFKAVSPRTMYCLRRFIVDNDLINTHKIKFILSPQKINLGGFACEPLVKAPFQLVEDEFKSIFSNNFSEEKVQCMIEKFRENKFGDIIVTIKLLKDIKITDYQVKEYRKKFEDMMDKFGVIVEDCQ